MFFVCGRLPILRNEQHFNNFKYFGKKTIILHIQNLLKEKKGFEQFKKTISLSVFILFILFIKILVPVSDLQSIRI